MSSTIVKSIDFHKDHHLNQGGVYLLEKEMKHYWKEQKIELNWDKTKPLLSLENTIKFIENTSNILASKDDYFLIKNVSLTSKETHKKLIKESFKRTITSRYGGGVKDKTKTFNQEIKVINSDRSRPKKKLEFLKNQYEKINNLNQLGIQLFRESGGVLTSDLSFIHKQIVQEKATLKQLTNKWFLQEKYKWDIIKLKSKNNDTD